jgi:hypothetical protein
LAYREHSAWRGLLLFGLAASLSVAQTPVLWRNPGAVGKLDFAGGPGGRAGAPVAPFRFLNADPSGTTPKVTVLDKRGRRWSVKWGEEVKAETFASRLVWAAGYHVEPSYFVRSGRIIGTRDLGRADKFIDKRGYFRDARFEARDPSARFLQNVDWTWEKNPFRDTRQLNGLKLLIMLTSNWDNKDARDSTSNTGILQRGTGPGRQWVYFVSDWGGTMGKWGNLFTRSKWDCDGFAGQSKEFVKEIDGKEVQFGFNGQHDNEFRDDITIADVRWVMQYLGRVTDSQIRAGLRAAGASPHEQTCFVRALRARINQLQQVTSASYRARRR